MTGAIHALLHYRTRHASHAATEAHDRARRVRSNPSHRPDLVVGLPVTLEVEDERERLVRRAGHDRFTFADDHAQRTRTDRNPCGGTTTRTVLSATATASTEGSSSRRTDPADAIGTPNVNCASTWTSDGFRTRTITPSPSSAGFNADSTSVDGTRCRSDRPCSTSGVVPADDRSKPELDSSRTTRCCRPVCEQRQPSSERSQALRARRRDPRPGRIRPRRQPVAGEPSGRPQQRDRERPVAEHFAFRQAWRAHDEAARREPALVRPRRRGRVHPAAVVNVARRAFGHAERRRRPAPSASRTGGEEQSQPVVGCPVVAVNIRSTRRLPARREQSVSAAP